MARMIAIGIIFISILAILIVMVFQLTGRSLIFQPRASTLSNCQVLMVQVSADGRHYSDSVNLPSKPTRYYLQAKKSDGTPCSSGFDANAQFCSVSGVCGSFKTQSPWGIYHSDNTGIARLDIDSPIADGTYRAQFRPTGSNLPWSNTISVKVGASSTTGLNQQSPLITIDYSQFFKFEPGYTYIFTSKNHVWDGSGTTKIATTRLQIEKETNWGGFLVRPWRFTKDSIYAYWRPAILGLNIPDQNLRWMVVSPNFKAATIGFPQFDNYIWAIGDKRYLRNNDNSGLKDVNQSAFTDSYNYRTTTGNAPAYTLAPKSSVSPYQYFGGYTSFNPRTSDLNYAPIAMQNAPANSGWKLRSELVPLKIDNGNFHYSGEGLRIDYFESGAADINAGIYKNGLLRESWYFAKNIGLVRIQDRHFNQYGGISLNLAPMCSDSSDCLADNLNNPDDDIILSDYYLNPQFSVSVSSNDVQYEDSLTISQKQGYYLRLNNSNFTGYLEAKSGAGRGQKWLWVDNGKVFIPPSVVATLKPAVYKANFRVWAPNEIFPGETRSSLDVNIPWSNEIAVTVQ